MELSKSPLHIKYLESNAKLVNFAGWEMPISFEGLIQEHNSVRKSAGFFDISHMGVISIKGQDIKDKIQKFFPTNIHSISQGKSCYTLLLNKVGGIIDDLILYDMGIQDNNLSEVFLIVNASRYKTDLEWIKKNLLEKDIQISNAKTNKALIAIQGKNSFKLFEQWSDYSLSDLPFFGFEYKSLDKFKEKVFFSKTGYTGEDGLEILLSKELALNLWNFLLTQNVPPCGLGARDTLRIEAGLPLYGQDITEATNPYESGLSWVVDLDSSHSFYGKDILTKISSKGVQRKLVGLEIKGKAIARKGCEIIAKNELIGHITSGSWSPSLQKPIAFGFVDIQFADLNQEVEVIIRERKIPSIIAKKAFYKKS